MDVRRGVVSTFPVLSSQRYYGGGLTGTGSGQQEPRGCLPVMAAATTMVVATGQRYVTGAAQRYDGTGIVVPGRSVFGVTVIDSEKGDNGESLQYFTLVEYGNGYIYILSLCTAPTGTVARDIREEET